MTPKERLVEILEDVHWNGNPECAESGLGIEATKLSILSLFEELLPNEHDFVGALSLDNREGICMYRTELMKRVESLR